MAKQTVTTLVDDLDGGPADEQVRFAFDGKAYEVDLSGVNAKGLREALAPFVAAARRTVNGRTPAARSRPFVDRDQNQAVRAWARQQGMKVADRGRIPAEVVEAYHQSGQADG